MKGSLERRASSFGNLATVLAHDTAENVAIGRNGGADILGEVR